MPTVLWALLSWTLWPELKPGVEHLTDWVTRAPPDDLLKHLHWGAPGWLSWLSVQRRLGSSSRNLISSLTLGALLSPWSLLQLFRYSVPLLCLCPSPTCSLFLSLSFSKKKKKSLPEDNHCWVFWHISSSFFLNICMILIKKFQWNWDFGIKFCVVAFCWVIILKPLRILRKCLMSPSLDGNLVREHLLMGAWFLGVGCWVGRRIILVFLSAIY